MTKLHLAIVLSAVAAVGVSMAMDSKSAATIRISALELRREFDRNAAAAEERFGSAALVVSGEVAEIGGSMRRGLARLVGAGGTTGATVRVELQSSEIEKAAALRRGSRVLLSCDGCQKSFGEPNLRACKIEEAATLP
jgi:hypothetical protein